MDLGREYRKLGSRLLWVERQVMMMAVLVLEQEKSQEAEQQMNVEQLEPAVVHVDYWGLAQHF